jgi:hypothetical protein
MTSPRGLAWAASAPAALARGLGVMAGLAQALPVRLVPEQERVATVRHHMVDHGRGHHASLSSAGSAQRALRQEGCPGPAPAGTITSACRARPLPVQLSLHRRRAPRPWRTVHGRLRGQRRLQHAETRRGHAGRAVGHTLQACKKATACDVQMSTILNVQSVCLRA